MPHSTRQRHSIRPPRRASGLAGAGGSTAVVLRRAGGPGRNRTATVEDEGFTDPWAHHLPDRPTTVTMPMPKGGPGGSGRPLSCQTRAWSAGSGPRRGRALPGCAPLSSGSVGFRCRTRATLIRLSCPPRNMPYRDRLPPAQSRGNVLEKSPPTRQRGDPGDDRLDRPGHWLGVEQSRCPDRESQFRPNRLVRRSRFPRFDAVPRGVLRSDSDRNRVGRSDAVPRGVLRSDSDRNRLGRSDARTHAGTHGKNYNLADDQPHLHDRHGKRRGILDHRQCRGAVHQ